MRQDGKLIFCMLNRDDNLWFLLNSAPELLSSRRNTRGSGCTGLRRTQRADQPPDIVRRACEHASS